MPRADLRMSSGEVRALLTSSRFAVLVSVDEHGDPVGELVPCRYEAGSDHLVVPGGGVGTGPVCVVVEVQPTYDTMRGVAAHGVPRVVDGELTVGLDDVVSFDFGRGGAGSPA